MPLKSILRAVGALFEAPRQFTSPTQIDRLQGRRDWPKSLGPCPPDPHGTGGPLDGAPKWWDNGELQRDAACYRSPPWPADDDPYARPEPCTVIVQDQGLSTIQNWAARTNANTAELADVQAMSDAAVSHMLSLGFQWRDGAWRMPNSALEPFA